LTKRLDGASEVIIKCPEVCMTNRPGMTSQPAQSEHSRAVFKNNLRGEDAYSRHQRYIRDYEQVYGSGRASGSVQKRTDFDVLKAAHR
jgi:hypothetical protein